jgi:antitoxin HigA-1
MSIENTRERKIRPTHPGEMLREDFLTDYGLTVSGLAFWLNAQRAVDLWDAERTLRKSIHQIKPLTAAYKLASNPVVVRETHCEDAILSANGPSNGEGHHLASKKYSHPRETSLINNYKINL